MTDMETEVPLEDDEQLRRREIGLRARRRELESREFKLQSFLSGVYVYTTFTLCISMLGFIALGAILALVVCAGLVAAYVYAGYRLWRRAPVSPWLLATPSILFVALALPLGGWRGAPFWFNVAGGFALYLLASSRHKLAALPNYSLKRTAASGYGVS